MKRRQTLRNRRSKRSSKQSKRRSGSNRRRTPRKQRGGADIPSGYEDRMVLSYTPKAEPGEIGNPDAVPRIGSVDDFKADAAAANA